MSHGVHAVQHEVEHRLEHEEHGKGDGGHGHDTQNKRIALVISVLALFLAFSETLGKSAQTDGLGQNIEASNLWAFYQAKSIRQNTLVTAADSLAVTTSGITDPASKAAITAQIEKWRKTAARYESEPKPTGGEGRRELSERAIHAQEKRDLALAKYHNFEIASAALQIGIVLASASVITGMFILTWLAGGVGLVGLAFMGLALFAPHFHLFASASH